MKKTTIYRITKITLIVSLIVVLGWDLFAQLHPDGGLKTTASWAIWEFGQRAPWVFFLVGFFMGHVVWGSPISFLKQIEKEEQNGR